MNKFSLVVLLAFLGLQFASAQHSQLSVEKIMQDPSWMGTFPSDIRWDEDSESIYFQYNADNDPSDSLYKIDLDNTDRTEKLSWQEKKQLIPFYGSYNKSKTKKLVAEDGKIVLYDLRKGDQKELLELDGRLSGLDFLADEKFISFSFDNNAYLYNLNTGSLDKLTNLNEGKAPKDKKEEKLSEKDQWVKQENLELLQVVRERKEKREASEEFREQFNGEDEFSFYSGDRQISNIKISPDAKFVSFNLITRGERDGTIVPDYVDASGHTVDLSARSKVGDDQTKVELAIYNLEKDTVYLASVKDLPGLTDLPDYVKDYPEKEWKKEPRELVLSEVYFSDNGKNALVNVRSKDNKDRWITLLDLETGELSSLDRQRDEAWIAGPGIGWTYGGGTLGWLPDNRHIYFQSEETGYSHLYLLDIQTGKKKQLTSGEFEVFDPFLSKDKKHWYLTTSEVHPGERHFYRMPVMGGKMEKLTRMTGNNQVSLSPDEKYMAILHSYSNQPWELYLKKTSSSQKAEQLTSGLSEEFSDYPWRDPELITFTASDGAQVPARLFVPEADVKNNAAVVFVHGAGYLQNAHKWWSSYFREYMFHNLLTDLGYTVIDIDYRGSAGYGRDWRTGIYRHMGGKDLSDQVDGVKYLIAEHDIDPEKVGIYGGSYGGFITLMALFTEPETFTSGAALRSVTDWAHYNHGYTSNILNEPALDPIAYRRSSPIYFAEGFEGNLLIAHGMVDVNVHFQDVVRLAQRLIELKKENWEMAVYPVEDHGFVEPTSWMDEYKRILKLFNETLLD